LLLKRFVHANTSIVVLLLLLLRNGAELLRGKALFRESKLDAHVENANPGKLRAIFTGNRSFLLLLLPIKSHFTFHCISVGLYFIFLLLLFINYID